MKPHNRRFMCIACCSFLVGLTTRLFEHRFTNVRMGLSAHLEGVMNCILLLALGDAWDEARLPHPVRVAAYCTALCGAYLNWLVTSPSTASTPQHHFSTLFSRHGGQPWQSFVALGVLIVTIRWCDFLFPSC